MSLSEKVFQWPKVEVNRFGWNLVEKLGVMRYFKSHLDSLLCLLVLELQYGSKVSWQSVASLDSWLDSRFSIPARIENKLSRIASRIESRRTENKRFTHDSFLDNFSKTYSCNTTWQGYIRASDCMLETRPIQVIKRMFLQGQLYQASFPQLKFQVPAPNANKQCVTRVQATACLFCNVNFGAYLLYGRLAW